jgi:trehalose 6-phosphate synthase/phosphatase
LFSVIEACRGRPLTLLLDYDGTLVPIAPTPDLAAPDEDLRLLLGALASQPDTSVHIVSGRGRSSLQEWFGHLPLALWAEHGFWYRAGPGSPWQPATAVPNAALERLLPILQDVTTRTPGSFVEQKDASLTWHFRQVDPATAARASLELARALERVLPTTQLEIMEGKKVLEIRVRGVNKGIVGARVADRHAQAGCVIAVGDDKTDEELFRSMPDSSITVSVGSGNTSAKFKVAQPDDVRELLRSLIEANQLAQD